jgi:hypothetical protein
MIGVLQRLGHRETIVGFLALSVFAVIVMHVSAALLPAPFMTGAIPVITAVATGMLGAIIGRNVASWGIALGVAFLALNTLPVALAGAVVTAVAPPLGWPLLAAPFLLAVGAAIGMAQMRRSDGYKNPGSAAAGATVAFGVFMTGAWLALGAMDARFGQGVIEVRSYAVEYDCLDPQHARLAAVIRSLGSENNRTRIESVFGSGDARPCKP